MSIRLTRFASPFAPESAQLVEVDSWAAWWAELQRSAPRAPTEAERASKEALEHYKTNVLRRGWSPAEYIAPTPAMLTHLAARADAERDPLKKTAATKRLSAARAATSYRAKETATNLLALCADLEGMHLDKAAESFRAFAGMLHTTASDAPEAPRLRLVLVLSRPVTATEYEELMTALLSILPPLEASAAAKAKDPSRFWYVPDADALYSELTGVPFDVDATLERLRGEASKSPEVSTEPVKNTAESRSIAPASTASRRRSSKRELAWARSAIARTIARIAETPKGTRHEAANRESFTLGGLIHVGLDPQSVAAELLAAMSASGWEVSKHEQTVHDAIAAGQREPFDVAGRLASEDDAKARAEEQAEREAVADEENLSEDGDADLRRGTDPFSDLGNAERLIAWHGEDLRYIIEWEEWAVWNGATWARDHHAAERRAIETVRRMAIDAAEEFARAPTGRGRAVSKKRRSSDLAEWAARSQSSSAISAMAKMARTMPGVTASLTDFDRDPWLLPCANGTIDLRTGRLRPHRREDMCMRASPVIFDPEARDPVWERYLEFVTLGSKELGDFLRRAMGYSITGSTREDRHFIFHNKDGGTGKSTFTATMRSALGTLAGVTSSETFLEQRFGRSPSGPSPDLAELAGVRLTISSEIPEGRKIDEALFKTFTGGEPVKARRLNEQLVEFVPRFKLLLSCNDLPRASDQDDGFWRRVLRIKFGRKLEEHEKDKSLREHLTTSPLAHAAVLAWAVRGCLEWQQIGLAPPPEVLGATAEYRAEQDPIIGFLDGYIVTGGCITKSGDVDVDARGRARVAGHWINQGELRKAYEKWAETEGKHALGATKFNARLKSLGCVPLAVRPRDNGSPFKVWIGIRAKSVAEQLSEAADPLDS